MHRIASLALFSFLIASVAPLAAHDGPHGTGPTDRTFKVGKNGDVKIGMDVLIGETLVKKGKYLFEHRVDGDRHILLLTQIQKGNTVGEGYEVELKLRPSGERVKKSALVAAEQRDRMYRVITVQIAADNAEYLPMTARTLAASQEG